MDGRPTGHSYLLLAFCSVIVGGLGSVRGAFFASLLFGVASGLNFLILPTLPGVAVYILLITLVLIRPNGFYPELSQ